MVDTMHKAPPEKAVAEVPAELVARWLATENAVLIDVREDFEHAEESIEGATHLPLSAIDPDALRDQHAGRRLVFHCRSGSRARDAANRFCGGADPVFCLEGGIDAWKAAGLDVTRSAHGPRLPVMRQVQIVAGSLVVVGVGLGAAISPWFLAIAGFVGCGLVFAGVSGWCGMARLLAQMPWNRRPKTDASNSTDKE